MATEQAEHSTQTAKYAEYKKNLPEHHDILRALMVRAMITFNFVPEIKVLDFDEVDIITTVVLAQKLLPLYGKYNRLHRSHMLICLQVIHEIANAYPQSASDIEQLVRNYHKLAEILDIDYDLIAPDCLPKSGVCSLKTKALFVVNMHKKDQANQPVPADLVGALEKFRFDEPQPKSFAYHAHFQLDGELYPAEVIAAVVLKKISDSKEDKLQLHYALVLASVINDVPVFRQLCKLGASVVNFDKGMQSSINSFLLERAVSKLEERDSRRNSNK